MNILFLTLLDFKSVNERNIYTDLLREFIKNRHTIYSISPIERRKKTKTYVIKEKNSKILKLCIGNIQKTNIVEKGISTILIESQFIYAIRKYFINTKFDLVLYSTPPITFCRAVDYVKQRDGARTYLLLKDIFPQNAVDMGMMNKTGLKSLMYKHFRNQEKKLYRISDCIGCMSQANVEYVLNHNPEVKARNDREKGKNGRSIVEVCPNCIEPIDTSISIEERVELRKKYNIPLDKKVFVYGGNLGKPQGIDFMISCLHSQRENDRAFFLIVGNGTEYSRIEQYVEKHKPTNIALHQWLPKEEYDKLVAACDVGMIFLDHRFTIPNFPSRLLCYMQAKLPVLAVTDTNTDIGNVIMENGFGWWCESNIISEFEKNISNICNRDCSIMGKMGYAYLSMHYSVNGVYERIINN